MGEQQPSLVVTQFVPSLAAQVSTLAAPFAVWIPSIVDFPYFLPH
jgi:hypothetical protein